MTQKLCAHPQHLRESRQIRQNKNIHCLVNLKNYNFCVITNVTLQRNTAVLSAFKILIIFKNFLFDSIMDYIMKTVINCKLNYVTADNLNFQLRELINFNSNNKLQFHHILFYPWQYHAFCQFSYRSSFSVRHHIWTNILKTHPLDHSLDISSQVLYSHTTFQILSWFMYLFLHSLLFYVKIAIRK